jgi:hypothetical protein
MAFQGVMMDEPMTPHSTVWFHLLGDWRNSPATGRAEFRSQGAEWPTAGQPYRELRPDRVLWLAEPLPAV